MDKDSKEKYSKIQRAVKILEYLRRNSDKDNTITQVSLRKDAEISNYLGSKETYNDTIVNLAIALNNNENGAKQDDEWKIIFDDFKKAYGNNQSDDENDELDSNQDTMRIKNLYYNHLFSYNEIDKLIEGILFSKTIDSKTSDTIIKKIENNLTTKFYKTCASHICHIEEPSLAEKEPLQENLCIIQQAIDDEVNISFTFNGYNHNKEIVSKQEYTVSPYYIVANTGKYYLIACNACKRKCAENNMSVWRIDLITNIDIPNRNDKLKIKGKMRINKADVNNLPAKWDSNFQLSHLNMSFDKPQIIKLRIKSPKNEKNPAVPLRPDYAFMFDAFGNTFKYIRTEDTVPYDDIVQVNCSPFGMVNWALQYSDRVEVLAPKSVRDEVINKINNLYEKYKIK